MRSKKVKGGIRINKKLLKKSRAKNPRYEEAKIQKWIIENDQLVEKRDKIIVIDCEISLPRALATLQRETHYGIYGDNEGTLRVKAFGRIDYLIKYKGVHYACELKFIPFSNSDFWQALKILGYTVYYNWWRSTNYKPAIIIPVNKYKLEHFIVAARLKIKLFGITKQGNGYRIEEVQAPGYK